MSRRKKKSTIEKQKFKSSNLETVEEKLKKFMTEKKVNEVKLVKLRAHIQNKDMITENEIEILMKHMTQQQTIANALNKSTRLTENSATLSDSASITAAVLQIMRIDEDMTTQSTVYSATLSDSTSNIATVSQITRIERENDQSSLLAIQEQNSDKMNKLSEITRLLISVIQIMNATESETNSIVVSDEAIDLITS